MTSKSIFLNCTSIGQWAFKIQSKQRARCRPRIIFDCRRSCSWQKEKRSGGAKCCCVMIHSCKHTAAHVASSIKKRSIQKGVLLSIITVLVVDIFSLSSAVIQYVVVVFIVSFLLLFISARIQRLLFFSALLLPQLLLLLLPSKKLNWGKQSYSFSYWHSVRAFCTAQR